MTRAEQREWCRSLERAYGMTLVAGGILYDQEHNRAKAIVVTADRMLSGPGASLHSPYNKVTRMGENWLLGYAGTPAHLNPIRNRVYGKQLTEKTSNEVVELLVQSYREYREERIEEELLQPYGFPTREDFYERGRDALGGDLYQKLVVEVRNYDLDIEFLLAGWSPKTEWDIKLVSVGSPGSSYDHLMTTVAAVGSGAPIALGHLYSFFNSLSSDVKHAQYRLLEAKFMSEAERSVGPDTMLVTLYYGGEVVFTSGRECEAVRAIWRARQTEVPQEALNVISTPELKPPPPPA